MLVAMSNDEQTSHQGEKARGKAKQVVGKATGDDALENQGRKDQSKSDLKQAGEKVKKAFKR
jgi:uncharacterized protein YjbJ (UPF0337 family)